MFLKKVHTFILAAVFTGFIGGCTTNPVTGKSEITLVGEQWELDVGRQAYSSYRQAMGGDYVVDASVEKYVNDVGQRLARVSDRDLPYEFNVLNSSVPNAWALPGGKIAINRGLLTELNSEAELAAVLGHEIVHAAARHGARAQTRNIGLQIGILGAAIAGGSGYGEAASLGAQLVNQKYSRGAELESDEYGMLYMSRAGYDPSAAIDLQQTFVRLSEGRNADWLSGLFASHPPSQKRVSMNRKTAEKLPKNGEIGTERYKQSLKTLFTTKPAYDAYDEAVAAANEKNFSRAGQLLKKAKSIEPREALFDLLDGDLAAERGDRNAALSSYDRAASKNPDFFAPFAKRGALYYEMGNRSAAKKDLNRSLDMLPGYPVTHYTLGRIALDERNTALALKHFEAGARSNSEIGQKSYAELVKLDLVNNPDKYIQTSLVKANSGELIVNITNKTTLPISNIVVDIQVKDKSGRTGSLRRELRQTLSARQQASIGTGIGASNVSTASARAVNARLAN